MPLEDSRVCGCASIKKEKRFRGAYQVLLLLLEYSSALQLELADVGSVCTYSLVLSEGLALKVWSWEEAASYELCRRLLGSGMAGKQTMKRGI